MASVPYGDNPESQTETGREPTTAQEHVTQNYQVPKASTETLRTYNSTVHTCMTLYAKLGKFSGWLFFAL